MKHANNFAPVDLWEDVLAGENRGALEALLPGYLRSCRWFGGKARDIAGVSIAGVVSLHGDGAGARIVNVRVDYVEGEPQTYVLPLNFAEGTRAEQLADDVPQAVLAWLHVGGQEGVLYDATWDTDFAMSLLGAIQDGGQFTAGDVMLVGWRTDAFERVLGLNGEEAAPRVMRAQQSNTSIAYGDRAILKMFRRLEEGTSPDLEVGRFLGEIGFAHTPPLAGALEYTQAEGEPLTLAILQGFVSNKGDAWQYTLDSLDSYLDYGLSQGAALPEEAFPGDRVHMLDLLTSDVPEPISRALGHYLDSARLLGRRTAEMHLALASGADDPAFAPEPFTAGYLQGLYSSVGELTETAFRLLQNRMGDLPENIREEAKEVISSREGILAQFHPLLQHRIEATRIRCHGDYHLGQVLYTGDDFVIIDFEGEPVRSLRERRLKHSPLKDVAGMLRSFHYAAYAAMFTRTAEALDASEDVLGIEAWADAWHLWVGASFLREYLHVASQGSFLPQKPEDLRTLLDAYLLEKAVYELIYELNNRPDWVRIPLQGVRELAG